MKIRIQYNVRSTPLVDKPAKTQTSFTG
jgi:hypothetical protein